MNMPRKFHSKRTRRKQRPELKQQFFCTTTDFVPNHEVTEVIGVVTGSSVMSLSVGGDLMASMKGIVGGEITQYGRLIEEARFKAVEKLKQSGRDRYANAVVNVRFSTNTFPGGLLEVMAYGSAVKTQRLEHWTEQVQDEEIPEPPTKMFGDVDGAHLPPGMWMQ